MTDCTESFRSLILSVSHKTSEYTAEVQISSNLTALQDNINPFSLIYYKERKNVFPKGAQQMEVFIHFPQWSGL